MGPDLMLVFSATPWNGGPCQEKLNTALQLKQRTRRGGNKSRKRVCQKDLPVWGWESEEFQQGWLEFRNNPSENSLSPAQMTCGHQLRSIEPTHSSAYATCCKSVMDARNRQRARDAESKRMYEVCSRSLPHCQFVRTSVCRTPFQNYEAIWEQFSRMAATAHNAWNSQVRVMEGLALSKTTPRDQRWRRDPKITGIGQRRDRHSRGYRDEHASNKSPSSVTGRKLS